MSTDKSEFEELKEIVLENNRILRNLESKARLATIFGVIKWFVYIGIVIGLFAFMKPIYEQLLETYSGIKESTEIIMDGKTAANDRLDTLLQFLK